MFHLNGKWLLTAFVLLTLLAATPAEAQRVCFSFASEDNVDGPNTHGFPLNLLTDAQPDNPDGLVQVRLLIQPFCDSGMVVTRNLWMRAELEHHAYQLQGFSGRRSHDWATAGQLGFIDPNTGTVFLRIVFNQALLTSWSPASNTLGHTATLQVSEPTDPNIQIVSSPELDAILVGAGFNPNLLNFGEQLSLTLSDLRAPTGPPLLAPVDPATGDWLDEWLADGSFTAAAGI